MRSLGEELVSECVNLVTGDISLVLGLQLVNISRTGITRRLEHVQRERLDLRFYDSPIKKRILAYTL